MNNQNTDLVQVPFNFSALTSDFSIWKFRNVSKDDTLIMLKELDLLTADGEPTVTAARATAPSPAATAVGVAAAAAAAHVLNHINYWNTREQAEKELGKSGKIRGFEVLNVRTLQKLWISHYGMEALINPS